MPLFVQSLAKWLRATVSFPSQEQRYLAQSLDLADLERRIRGIERRGPCF